MMHQQLECGWAEGLDYQAVELPYDGGQLAMLVLVPELGSLDEFEQRLDGAFIEDLHANMQWGMVELAMPRWEYDGETIKLVEPLKALGMGIAFENGQADFSGINGRHDLFIHNVLHQAFVKVNEKGTEAAAATAVIVGDVGIPPQGPAVTLDRPFIYLIQDRPTGQILFLNRDQSLADPTAAPMARRMAWAMFMGRMGKSRSAAGSWTTVAFFTPAIRLRPTLASTGVNRLSHSAEMRGLSTGTRMKARLSPRWRAYSCIRSR
jgi:hypothetical protein